MSKWKYPYPPWQYPQGPHAPIVYMIPPPKEEKKGGGQMAKKTTSNDNRNPFEEALRLHKSAKEFEDLLKPKEKKEEKGITFTPVQVLLAAFALSPIMFTLMKILLNYASQH